MKNFFNTFKIFLWLLNHPLNKKSRIKAAFRIIWWKVNQLIFRIPAIVTLYGTDIKAICYPNSSYGSLVVYNNLPEYKEMQFLKKILNTKSIFVDVGANIGIYSLIAASKIDKGMIYAFEPVEAAYKVFNQSISLNNLLSKISLSGKVISNKDGRVKFAVKGVSEISSIASNKSDKSILIPSIKLDNFFNKEKHLYIDVIKIDVEGAELLVLKGMSSLLRKSKVGYIILEINSNSNSFGNTATETLNFLKSFGYDVFELDNNLKLKPLRSIYISDTFNIIATRGIKNKL